MTSVNDLELALSQASNPGRQMTPGQTIGEVTRQASVAATTLRHCATGLTIRTRSAGFGPCGRRPCCRWLQIPWPRTYSRFRAERLAQNVHRPCDYECDGGHCH